MEPLIYSITVWGELDPINMEQVSSFGYITESQPIWIPHPLIYSITRLGQKFPKLPIQYSSLGYILKQGIIVIPVPTGFPLPYYLTKKSSSLYAPERELLQVMNQEAVLKFGIPVEFYRIAYDENYLDPNRILGENNNKIVINKYEVMVWYKISRENRMWTKFGIESNDIVKMTVPKAHFQYKTNGYFPQAGDLIIEKSTSRVFEVLTRDESEESHAYLQSQQYNWKLETRLYDKQELLTFAEDMKNTKLYEIMNVNDKLKINNVIPSKVDDIFYQPKLTEQANKNPFVAF